MMEKSIILVHYLKFEKHNPTAKIREVLVQHREKVVNPLGEKGIINIVVPVWSGESRVECINPQLISEHEYTDALAAINEAIDSLDNFLSESKTKVDG